MPKPKKEGFDPRLVALGAIGGAAYGRATNSRRATSSVGKEVAANTKWEIENIRSDRDVPTRTNEVARNVMQDEYGRMPRSKNQAGIDLYGTLRKGGNSTKEAQKLSGLSGDDMKKLYKKKGALTDMIGNNSTTGRMRQASRLRAARTNRSSSIKGGIGGAALAALVQLVAKELNKK
jgi:hypothetical protein